MNDQEYKLWRIVILAAALVLCTAVLGVTYYNVAWVNNKYIYEGEKTYPASTK